MEFREVESLNKEVIVKIQNNISLKDLVSYMEKWGFSKMTIEHIKADIRNEGQTYAVMTFLDAVRKRPNTFPKLVAALQHSGQEEVYEIFMRVIRKYYSKSNKQHRYNEVLAMIEVERRELSEEHRDDSTAQPFHTSGNGTPQQELFRSHSDEHVPHKMPAATETSQIVYRKKDCQPSTSSDHLRNRVTSDSQLVVQGVKSKPLASVPSTSLSASLPTPGNNTPGATGGLGEGVQDQSASSVTPKNLDPNFAGKCISSLKANVYKMLGKALEQKNTQGDDNEPWWNHIINNGDLNVSRKEQRQIGRHGSPGVEFLDIFDERDYTLQDLERLFIQFQIDEALRILRLHQNKVIEERHVVQTDQNNLNISQGTKADQSKVMNILQTDSSNGPTAQTPSASSVRSSVDEQENAGEMDRNSKARDLHLSTQLSDLSLESNSLQSIEDESIKGTTPVQAHGDQAGERAQPNPEQDSEKLRNDRVHQFDNDPAALEETSFIPVNHEQLPVSNEMTRNVSDNQSECQMNIDSLLQENTDEVTNSQSLPVIQAEPTVPFLSQLQSMDSSMENQSQDPIVRPEGIVNVSPRSLTSHEQGPVANDVRRNISDYEREGQMNIDSLLQENTDEFTNSQSMPVIQAGPIIPLLSQLQSMDSSTENQSQDPSVRPEGIVNVSPRSLTSHEAVLGNIPLTTGVTYVSSSLSFTGSREETENSSVEHAGESSTPASSGHLSDPDLIRGTELQRNASNS